MILQIYIVCIIKTMENQKTSIFRNRLLYKNLGSIHVTGQLTFFMQMLERLLEL